MAVAPSDHRLAPLPGEFQNASIFLAPPHSVYFESMNRPAVTGKQVRDGNFLGPWCPSDKRVIQDDQAAARGESLKQFVVASAPRSRLNSTVRLIDSTLR